MKNTILFLIFLLSTILATRNPINGSLVFKNNIKFENSYTIDIHGIPQNCRFDDILLIKYSEMKYRIEIKNNYSDVFIMVIPFVDWNKLCVNICIDDISSKDLYSVLLRYLQFKSRGNSHIIYDIRINYVCHYRATPDSDYSVGYMFVVSLVSLILFMIITLIIYECCYRKKIIQAQYDKINTPAV